MAEARVDENIVDESKIQQFCSVTGSSVEAARELLQVCCGNLEMAIGMHMDGSCDAAVPQPQLPCSSRYAAELPGASADADEEDEVRAPIPQKREVLVEEAANIGFRARKARSVFDGFRDFQAEARQQEQSLFGASQSTQGNKKKQRTLEDLFRPPIDITFKGTFQNARDTGTRQNKWLLVNVQNVQEFPCQVLNRDIWSCPHIKNLIKEHFIFWQIYHDSQEGKKYMQFYKIKDWPYVAIVDPRTGENLVEWNKIATSPSLKTILTDFLSSHQNPESADNSPPNKRIRRENSIVDACEDEQLQAAIKASLSEEKTPQEDNRCIFLDSDSDQSVDLETFTDSEDETPSTSNTKDSSSKTTVTSCRSVCSTEETEELETSHDLLRDCATASTSSSSKDTEHIDASSLPTENSSSSKADTGESLNFNGLDEGSQEEEIPSGPAMNLLIRFPDGSKEHWNTSSTSTIKSLLSFIVSKGQKSGEFEVVTNFPRRQLHLLSPSATLESAGLHTKDTVFVHTL